VAILWGKEKAGRMKNISNCFLLEYAKEETKTEE
jgi:hypothetical protein